MSFFRSGFPSRFSRDEILFSSHRLASLWCVSREKILHSFGAFEWVTATYFLWLNAMIVLFHRNLPHPGRYCGTHLAILAVMATVALAASFSANRALCFVRDWYPLPLFLFSFEELEGLVHLVFPGWFDRYLIHFDYNFAGVHPSVWLAQFETPALTEVMQFAYMTYFLFLLLLPAVLWTARDRAAFWTVMVSTAIAHDLVYAVAVIFPVESPYYSLAALGRKPLVGGVFTATVGIIEHFGRVHGAAFPSAHVAGSTVAVLAARRSRPCLFRIFLPLYLLMCLATVYGRYHYVADVLAGVAVGAIGWIAGQLLMEGKGAIPNSKCN
jgi:membrane-associated phospholipid phosphatase